MILIGFMYRARYQYGNFGVLWIPRAKLIQSENDNFIDRGSANPSPSWGWEYYEQKYGKPDESNVEGYWIDDEIEVELEKPSGKERERERNDDRSYDEYVSQYIDYMRTHQEKYIDPYQDTVNVGFGM